PEWKGQKVAFNEVILKPVADPKTAELAFRSGELDFTVIEPAAAKEMAKLTDTDVISLDSINFVWIGINVSKPPFDNLKVRQ
ncbi:ABC transporter substrate-binding protein, partial [Acinetobacter baumannii]